MLNIPKSLYDPHEYFSFLLNFSTSWKSCVKEHWPKKSLFQKCWFIVMIYDSRPTRGQEYIWVPEIIIDDWVHKGHMSLGAGRTSLLRLLRQLGNHLRESWSTMIPLMETSVMTSSVSQTVTQKIVLAAERTMLDMGLHVRSANGMESQDQNRTEPCYLFWWDRWKPTFFEKRKKSSKTQKLKNV